MTLNTWIKINYGTQGKFNESLGLAQNTVNRWYNHNPKQFLLYIPKLSKETDTSYDDLCKMIEDRIEDVKLLSNA